MTFSHVPSNFYSDKSSSTCPASSTNNMNLLFIPKDNIYKGVSSLKYIPYIPRQKLGKSYGRRSTKIHMKEKLSLRRSFLIIFLLSFLPYLLPDSQKPDMYRFKTQEELEIIQRDRFIGGKIKDLPF